MLTEFLGNITIEGYSGTEIIFSTSEYNTPPERSKGLKPIYSKGTDNTGLGLYVERKENIISVDYLLPLSRNADFVIKVPASLAISIKNKCIGGNDIKVQNMTGDIEINACHDIMVKDVTGPVVLSTISGNIDVVFTTVRQEKPISISSISGEIDITLAAKTPANMELKTMSGEMYTDFELQLADDKELKHIGGSNMKSKINGGGVSIFLQTISGNIYLRKAK